MHFEKHRYSVMVASIHISFVLTYFQYERLRVVSIVSLWSPCFLMLCFFWYWDGTRGLEHTKQVLYRGAASPDPVVSLSLSAFRAPCAAYSRAQETSSGCPSLPLWWKRPLEKQAPLNEVTVQGMSTHPLSNICPWPLSHYCYQATLTTCSL